jgi:hypothetical protein
MPQSSGAGKRDSVFLQRTLKRVLVLPREVHDLVHFGFRNLVGKNAADTHALLMDVQHHASGLFQVHAKETLQHHDHKLHRCVVIIEQQNFVLAGLLGLCLGLGRDADVNVRIGIVIAGPGHVARYQERAHVSAHGGATQRQGSGYCMVHRAANIVSEWEFASYEYGWHRIATDACGISPAYEAVARNEKNRPDADGLTGSSLFPPGFGRGERPRLENLEA